MGVPSELPHPMEKSVMTNRALSTAVIWLLVGTVWADDFEAQRMQNWHQWRGPEATGVAPHGDPPTHWDEQTNVKWKVPIPGRGCATPIIWQDRVFVLTAIKTDRQVEPAETSADATAAAPVQLASHTEPAQQPPADALAQADAPQAQEGTPPGDGDRPRGEGRRGGRGRRGFGFDSEAPTNFYQFVVICLDRNTGETIWQRTACEAVPHEGHHTSASFASASPTTDGERLYVSFGSRGIYCYDMDGNLEWKRDLGQMRIKFGFGEGSSPALYGDTLVINWDHEGESFLTALDARTGTTRWKVDRDEATTWNTPLLVPRADGVQIVLNGANRARGYDLETGRVIWECGGQGPNPIPTSVTLDDTAYCMTGFRSYALYAIPLSATGDITDTDQIRWQLNEGTPYIPSPLLYNGRLYFTKSREAILSCVDARSGEVLFDKERLPDLETLYASPSGAAGRIYFVSRNGAAVVIKQADEFELLATNQLDDSFDASPVIVGKELFLRGENNLYCIAEP